MNLGNEKKSAFQSSQEEARKRLEIIQRERARINKMSEEKQREMKRESSDFLQRRKKPDTSEIPIVPVPPDSNPISSPGINKFLPKKTSNRVFIVCGGESINGMDLSLLREENTIAVNRSVFSVPDPTFFISMDNTFFGKITQAEKNNIITSGAEKIFIANFASGVLEEKNGVIRDTKNKVNYVLGFYDSIIKSNTFGPKLGDTIENFYAGNNSGFCALQLAILLGYEEIYLLGMDLISNKATHFHGGYGESPIGFNTKLMKYEDTIVKAIEKYKGSSKIISCSPYSKLNKYLPYKNYSEINFTEKKMGTLDDLIVVGYYTINTPYEKEAQKTIRSCIQFGLNHDFLGIQNLGNWQANTRYKAKFMLDMLEKHSGKRLLYVDCDAIIKLKPILFENYNCDIAVRYQDFRWRKNECLSGTIYMENNEKTKKLCRIWMDSNEKEGNQVTSFEQWNLGSAIEVMMRDDGLNFRNLPPEYTFIFDIMKVIYPNIKPVIEHFQASRKFRNNL